MSLWRGLMRGARAFPSGSVPSPYRAGGREVACPHCGGRLFSRARVLQVTALKSFFSLEWTGRQATTLSCSRCGLIRWFAIPPDPLEPKALARDAWLD